MRPTTLFAGALLALAAAGCSSGAKSPDEICPNPVAATTVEMADFSFAPGCVEIDAGTSLTLDNVGGAPHTFTVEGAEADVAAGETAELDLGGIAAGTYEVTCTYHPQMVGGLRIT